MQIIFRHAKLEDVKEIIELCNECFSENPKVSLEYALASFKSTMNDPNQIYIIGTLDDKIIAHCKLTIIPTMYEDMNNYSIINHFCVKNEYRRHNIATEMLKIIEKISLDMKCKSIKLWSNNYRIPAHSCYKKNGFELNNAGFFSKGI